MMLKKNPKIEISVPEQNGCTRQLLKDNGEEEDQRRSTTTGLKMGKRKGQQLALAIISVQYKKGKYKIAQREFYMNTKCKEEVKSE